MKRPQFVVVDSPHDGATYLNIAEISHIHKSVVLMTNGRQIQLTEDTGGRDLMESMTYNKTIGLCGPSDARRAFDNNPGDQ